MLPSHHPSREHPLQVTASGFFNVTVDVHREKRGEAYRQWQRSVDVAEATLFDIEMVPLRAPDTPLHPLAPPPCTSYTPSYTLTHPNSPTTLIAQRGVT